MYHPLDQAGALHLLLANKIGLAGFCSSQQVAKSLLARKWLFKPCNAFFWRK
jgi:hypothetical protein